MINTKRLIVAFVAVLAVAYVYEWLVFVIALRDFHAQFPDRLTPQDQLPMLRMFLTLGLSTALVTVFYALFARNRASSLMTGLVFGVFLGLIAGWVPQAYNKILFMDYPFYPTWAVAIFCEMVVVGATLGLVYRE